jgi:hypothetical protein
LTGGKWAGLERGSGFGDKDEEEDDGDEDAEMEDQEEGGHAREPLRQLTFICAGGV